MIMARELERIDSAQYLFGFELIADVIYDYAACVLFVIMLFL